MDDFVKKLFSHIEADAVIWLLEVIRYDEAMFPFHTQ